MFLHNTTLLISFVIGVILTLIGFGFRDRNPGVILMGIGFLAVLYAAVTKALQTFGQ